LQKWINTSPKNADWFGRDPIGAMHAAGFYLPQVYVRDRVLSIDPGHTSIRYIYNRLITAICLSEHLPVGKRAVIIGAELVSLSGLLTLMHAGVKCEMMLTEYPRHQIYFPYLPMKWGLADMFSRTLISQTLEFGYFRPKASRRN